MRKDLEIWYTNQTGFRTDLGLCLETASGKGFRTFFVLGCDWNVLDYTVVGGFWVASCTWTFTILLTVYNEKMNSSDRKSVV